MFMFDFVPVMVFLVFFLVIFCIGVINIVKAEEKATNVVTSTIEEAVDVIIAEGQIEKSIEFGTKDYQRRGTYILIISSVVNLASSCDFLQAHFGHP